MSKYLSCSFWKPFTFSLCIELVNLSEHKPWKSFGCICVLGLLVSHYHLVHAGSSQTEKNILIPSFKAIHFNTV